MPVKVMGITFDGPVVCNAPMRLELFAVAGERKWTAYGDGKMLSERFSKRTLHRLIDAILVASAAQECAAAE